MTTIADGAAARPAADADCPAAVCWRADPGRSLRSVAAVARCRAGGCAHPGRMDIRRRRGQRGADRMEKLSRHAAQPGLPGPTAGAGARTSACAVSVPLWRTLARCARWLPRQPDSATVTIFSKASRATAMPMASGAGSMAGKPQGCHGTRVEAMISPSVFLPTC